MTRPFDIVLAQKFGPNGPGRLWRWNGAIEADIVFLAKFDRSGWYAELSLANGQLVVVRRLSEERRKARSQLAEYRKAYPDIPRTWESEAVLPDDWKLTSREELEAKGVELHEININRAAEKIARHVEAGIVRLKNVRLSYPTLKELGYDEGLVLRQFVREGERSKEDEIRRMLGCWVSELEPTICFGPCGVPWGLHPAGHAVMGSKTKMTICSIWCPEELRNA